MNKLTHINNEGKARMVDVGNKSQQLRIAKAIGHIKLSDETRKQIAENSNKKGDVLTVAEIAGIGAAKQTSNLIPLCHTLLNKKEKVSAELDESGVTIRSEVRCIGQTGVEMEALTGVSVGLLTIYDMCKAVDKAMIIENIHLLEKEKHDLINE